ncbi:lipase 3-like [Eurosta solidaginis]|uniref:lipase 3-like n=1 Tax=Eurosta solidaginis TaxID=178769 RepID=UPI0035311513
MLRSAFVLFALVALCIVWSMDHLHSSLYIHLPLKPRKTSADRICEHGYPAESHYITTSDGYILNIFRIPYSPRLSNRYISKPVVFIQHGLMASSDGFLLNGPDNALAYNFADAGFDVWLGNARGNIYSRNHSTIWIKHPKFWKFSWHEIGTIDIPETIDYVLHRTGEKAIHYVGHSQGSTAYFVMLSIRPEYNAKIKTGHALAPAVFMGNATQDIIVNLVPLLGNPDGVGTKLLCDQQFTPYNSYICRILDTACGSPTKYPKYCRILYLLWSGGAQGNVNSTLLPQVAETHPAGISTNQAIHFIQSKVSNMFRQYDFGTKKNQKLYNQTEPPAYPLEKVTANTYLYYGLNDGAANASDVKRLAHNLPNLRLLHEVPISTWSHIDFVLAWQVKQEINDPVIQYCKDYEVAN